VSVLARRRHAYVSTVLGDAMVVARHASRGDNTTLLCAEDVDGIGASGVGYGDGVGDGDGDADDDDDDGGDGVGVPPDDDEPWRTIPQADAPVQTDIINLCGTDWDGDTPEIDLSNPPSSPFDLWSRLVNQRGVAGEVPPYGNPMILATCGEDGQPSCRVVLLKQSDSKGFVFVTDGRSKKARQLADNNRCSLVVHWDGPGGGWQVRVEGTIQRVTDEESDWLHSARPRDSQISAWASVQSSVLVGGRTQLEGRVAATKLRFSEGDVPRPPYWGGFRVLPTLMEVWCGGGDRLHDRVVYKLNDGGDGDVWEWNVLSP